MKSKDKTAERDLKDYYTIKIASILFSKMKKAYWELDWVKSKPFVIALMPSHNKLAYFLPDYLAIEYIYGKWFKASINEEGKIESTSGIKIEHNYEAKSIPSGFFEQENTENVSAIIFANTCETNKFNRMGQQGKYYDEDLIIVRTGSAYNNTPDDPANYFQHHVHPGNTIEMWSEGVSILHNPKAKYPLDRKLFEGVRQIWTTPDGKLDGEMPEFYPFNSITGILARLD